MRSPGFSSLNHVAHQSHFDIQAIQPFVTEYPRPFGEQDVGAAEIERSNLPRKYIFPARPFQLVSERHADRRRLLGVNVISGGL
jgi:hypothetical protein